MIIKDKFALLKGVPNTLSLSKSAISKVSIKNGPRKVFVILEMTGHKIQHFTKKKSFNLISDIKHRKKIHILNMPNYLLNISYNKPSDSIIINLGAFGIDDIYPNNPGVFNLYACIVYGIIFRDLINGKIKISQNYSSIISDYMMSVYMRLFAKTYGLLGSFTDQIIKLKFLINVYVLASFFGITGDVCFKKASRHSSYDYKEIKENLKKYDFSNIDDFIKALSELQIFPGINRYIFTSKVMRMFGVNFIPGLEDLSRFISILTTSTIKGSNIVPTFLSKYNENKFNNILEISRKIFEK